MNSFLIKIKNIWKGFCNFFQINPHKHWAFLLYMFSVLIILLILFSFYLLYQIKNEQIFQVKIVAEQKKTILREDLLNKIINLFDNKAQKELDIESNPPVYKDPSIY